MYILYSNVTISNFMLYISISAWVSLTSMCVVSFNCCIMYFSLETIDFIICIVEFSFRILDFSLHVVDLCLFCFCFQGWYILLGLRILLGSSSSVRFCSPGPHVVGDPQGIGRFSAVLAFSPSSWSWECRMFAQARFCHDIQTPCGLAGSAVFPRLG